MADSSLRDALTKAFESAESAEPEAAPDTAPVDTAPVEEIEAPVTEADDTAGADSAPVAGEQTAPAPAAAPAPTSAPPASWNKAEREAWASLPPAAQEAVRRREVEMNRVLQTSADARRQIQELDAIAEPYKPLMEKYGVTLAQAIPPLLATRALLEMGTKGQKITAIASMMRDFGMLDAEGIEMLDGALSAIAQGGYHPAPHQPAPTPDYRNHPDLAPLFQLAEQAKTAQIERAREAISTVANEPYYEEVRNTMADLLDMARARGKTLSIETAYKQAATIHGYEVTETAVARDAQGRFQSLAASRNAASSVSGSPKPSAPPAPGSGSLRDELTRNFNASRR